MFTLTTWISWYLLWKAVLSSGTWVAQSIKRLNLAQVMISGLQDWTPSGTLHSVGSLLEIPSLPFHLPRTLSQIKNKSSPPSPQNAWIACSYSTIIRYWALLSSLIFSFLPLWSFLFVPVEYQLFSQDSGMPFFFEGFPNYWPLSLNLTFFEPF